MSQKQSSQSEENMQYLIKEKYILCNSGRMKHKLNKRKKKKR